MKNFKTKITSTITKKNQKKFRESAKAVTVVSEVKLTSCTGIADGPKRYAAVNSFSLCPQRLLDVFNNCLSILNAAQ